MIRKLVYGFWLLTFPLCAFAYIDPGHATYFIQALMALISTVIFYFRHPVEFIKKFIKKFLGK
jgi:hypothetical protein